MDGGNADIVYMINLDIMMEIVKKSFRPAQS